VEHYGLALAYLAGAEFAKAEDLLRKVMSQYPDKSILKADLGVIFYEAGRYDEALKLFHESWSEDHNCAYASYYLARTYEQTGNMSRAMQLYDELLSVLPDYSPLYYRLGKIKASQGDKGAGYYYLGVYYWYEGDAKTAKIHLTQAMHNLPKDDPIALKSGAMLEKIERLENIE
jgi:predicted Zn-dependent protease